jgi:hypothetical protein
VGDLLELLLGSYHFIQAALGHLIHAPLWWEVGLLFQKTHTHTSVMLHPSAVRLIQPSQYTQQSCFPCSVRPHQTQAFPGMQLEFHTLK